MRTIIKAEHPPLFEEINFSEIGDLKNETELEDMGYLQALGNKYTRNKNQNALKAAQRAHRLNNTLDLVTQERVSKTIYKLTELWLSWTQDTREKFYFKYLNI